MTPEENREIWRKGFIAMNADDAGGVDMSTVSKKDLRWVGDELSALAFKYKDGATRMYLYGLFYSLYKDLK